MKDKPDDPLAHLADFTEWGGNIWVRLVKLAIERFLGRNLEGQRVLEIGSRNGGMSCLFGLLGGEVVGVEINPAAVRVAEEQAEKWGVADTVRFLHYEGDLSVLESGGFDIVFTKSVLLAVPGLDKCLQQISTLLKPDGKAVFIENARGNPVLQAVRRVKHGEIYYRKAHYFADNEIDQVRRVFDISILKRTLFPPVFLICGVKKPVQRDHPAEPVADVSPTRIQLSGSGLEMARRQTARRGTRRVV